ncbi:MAG: tetratricopeptide repeat protein [bacterium]|nr:tetratricopeptide repeat protein [bacterium]
MGKRRVEGVICLGLVAAVLLLYGQTAWHDFLPFDDLGYVVENPNVNRGLTPEAVHWAFTGAEHGGNWHPLTSLSHMLDVELFGLRPGPHHLVNAGLHALNAMLLFLVLNALSGARWCSASVAAIFALHPLHVESVAWISERKDVLSGAMFMVGLLAHTRYARTGDKRSYGMLFAAMALGILAKPMLVTLPCVLLLLDFWPLERGGRVGWWRLVAEKLPLFALSLLSAGMTLRAQTAAATLALLADDITPVWSLVQAPLSYVAYLRDAAWPTGLAVIYPHPAIVTPDRLANLALWAGAAVVLLVGFTAMAFRMRRSHPYVLIGWLWYLGMLVPVIGFVQVGVQASADRYAYLPMIGIYILVVWGTRGLLGGRPQARATATGVALLILLALSVRTMGQVALWRDGVTLFSHTVQVTERNYLAEFLLGRSLEDRGALDGARQHYERSLEIRPEFRTALQNLGGLKLDAGDADGAEQLFRKNVWLSPSDPEAHFHLALALADLGRSEAAAAAFSRALEFDPTHGGAHNNLGLEFMKRDPARAQRHLEQAVRHRPGAETHNNLGLIFWQRNDLYRAESQFEAALRFEPANEIIQRNLKAVREASGSDR